MLKEATALEKESCKNLGLSLKFIGITDLKGRPSGG